MPWPTIYFDAIQADLRSRQPGSSAGSGGDANSRHHERRVRSSATTTATTRPTCDSCARPGSHPAPGRSSRSAAARARMLDLLRREGFDAQGVEVNADDDRREPPAVRRPADSEGRRRDAPVRGRARFATVVSFDVFEHIPDSDAHLHEVTRVLSPGGAYFLQTPNKWTNVVFETIRWRSFTAFRVDHCSLHSYREIQATLREPRVRHRVLRHPGRDRLLPVEGAAATSGGRVSRR